MLSHVKSAHSWYAGDWDRNSLLDIFGTLVTGTETVWIFLACTGVSHTTDDTRLRLIQAHPNILVNY